MLTKKGRIWNPPLPDKKRYSIIIAYKNDKIQQIYIIF